jgi:hypothetical protein
MPHNSTIIVCKDAPVEAVVIVRIKNTKEQIKGCVDYKGYRTKNTRIQNLTWEEYVIDDQ